MYPADSKSPAIAKLPVRAGDDIARGVGSLAVDVFDDDVPPWAFIIMRPYVVDLPFKTAKGADEAIVMYYSEIDDEKREQRSVNPSFAAMMGESDAAMLLLRGTVAVVLVKRGRPINAVEEEIAKVTQYVCR
ncbi:hypothetical protein CC2G_003790 [Coprinopsis cinerea AmutBmut pab1-1]|nr:hypothetical protein CC2G_003790 [Coprinopsis cinerea AmutBmut pab1-1]